MWKPVTAEHKPVKRAWLRWGVFLLMSATLLSAYILSIRPQWQKTCISVQAGNALLIEVPQSWVWRREFRPEPTLVTSPPPPPALLRWYNEHLPGAGKDGQRVGGITISVTQTYSENLNSKHSELNLVKQATSSTFRRLFRDVHVMNSVQHGMEAYSVEGQHRIWPAGAQEDMRFYLLHDYNRVTHRSTLITLWLHTSPSQYSMMMTSMDEIIRRLRLVQNNQKRI